MLNLVGTLVGYRQGAAVRAAETPHQARSRLTRFVGQPVSEMGHQGGLWTAQWGAASPAPLRSPAPAIEQLALPAVRMPAARLDASVELKTPALDQPMWEAR